MNKVLIIEDDNIKIAKLQKYFADYDIILKESFQSCMHELKSNFSQYKILILDMTIPLWDKGNNDLGGNYEQFGGEKVLREMRRRKLFLPTVLFTMFDIFPNGNETITFNQLDTAFKKQFADFYLGAVFYNANEDNWMNDLDVLIKPLLDE